MTELIDAYAHVGMPRFQSLADCGRQMTAASIGRSVLCAFDASPALAEIHRGIVDRPRTFRGLGVPLGQSREEVEAGVRAQLAAGFSGIRLSDTDIQQRSWLLDVIDSNGGIPVVCGHPSDPDIAAVLAAHLDHRPESIMVGGHFAGARDPDALRQGAVAALFAHPGFHVVFSRHGGYPADLVLRWAEAIVGLCSWQRVMWGSESPVLFWRNETLASALTWVDQLHPTTDERAAFLGGNAERVYFTGPVHSGPLELPFDPWDRATPIPATLFANGVPIDQRLAGPLVRSWQDGDADTLGEHVQQLLLRTLDMPSS